MNTARRAIRTVTIGKSEIRPIRAGKARASKADHREAASVARKVTFIPGSPSHSVRFSELDQLKRSLARDVNGHGLKK